MSFFVKGLDCDRQKLFGPFATHADANNALFLLKTCKAVSNPATLEVHSLIQAPSVYLMRCHDHKIVGPIDVLDAYKLLEEKTHRIVKID